MQLTNNAIQKNGKEYQKYEEGNIISISTLFNNIATTEFARGRSSEEMRSSFQDDMERLIVDSMKSVKGKLLMQKYTFELFGYDFILDEDLNTILIECNTNPCLEESNTLLRNLLPRMIDDLLNIVMDPLFGPHAGNEALTKQKYQSKFPLSG